MHLSSSWRRVAVVLGATVTTAAMFATPAFAKPSHPAHPAHPATPSNAPKAPEPPKPSDVVTTIDCSMAPFFPAGVGTVTVFTNGEAKGHCSFPNGFPKFPGITPPGPGNHHAVQVPCVTLANDVATALGFTVSGTPTGQATLTPSGRANVNCRNVHLVRAV
jgi:hypothetical protein